MITRDLIVIGASMGGIDALSSVSALLPRDLPAAVLVVQHTGSAAPGYLSRILDERGPLAAVTAEDGMHPTAGCIYVARADRHMLLGEDGRIRVVLGPRENRSRPAIDPLFRTAAVCYRSRAIGVILTGLLADGAAGLAALARCGGECLVQDPAEAAYPDMPANALAAVPDARQLPLDQLAHCLVELAGKPAPSAPPVPKALEMEARLTLRGTEADWEALDGEATELVCAECRGPLRELRDGGWRRYRCRVGHAYSTGDLLSDNGSSVEQSLWVALQTLQERLRLLERLAEEDQSRGRDRSAAQYLDRAEEIRGHATSLRTLLERLLTSR